MTIIERGDTVSVRGEVVALCDSGNVKIDFGGQTAWFGADKVSIAKKRELQAGDVVTIALESLYDHYKIVAIDEKDAWLKADKLTAAWSPRGITVDVERLIRV